jgi:hypothetical protein
MPGHQYQAWLATNMLMLASANMSTAMAAGGPCYALQDTQSAQSCHCSGTDSKIPNVNKQVLAWWTKHLPTLAVACISSPALPYTCPDMGGGGVSCMHTCPPQPQWHWPPTDSTHTVGEERSHRATPPVKGPLPDRTLTEPAVGPPPTQQHIHT